MLPRALQGEDGESAGGTVAGNSGTGQQRKAPEVAKPSDPDNRPKLHKGIQSQSVLEKRPKDTQEGGEKPKKLKRSEPLQQVTAEGEQEQKTPEVPKKTTAVKAKASKPEETKEPAKAECSVKQQQIATPPSKSSQPQTKLEKSKSEVGKESSEVVNACLNRKDTQQLDGDRNTPSAKSTEQNSNQDDDGESSSEEGSEEERNAMLVRAKREAHARYMRFSRSLKSTLASKWQIDFV